MNLAMSAVRPCAFCFAISLLLVGSARLSAAQEPAADEPAVPEIRDEPVRIDPSVGLPESLTESVSVDFGESKLKDLIDWLEDDRGLTVLVDMEQLDLSGLSLETSYSDRLQNQPTYLLLDRLDHQDLAWTISDNLLTLTSNEFVETQLSTKPYMVGGLRDLGFEMDAIVQTIEFVVDPESWENLGGNGRILAIGDVIMVLQTDKAHREIEMLLEALREPSRRVLVGDPIANQVLRDALTKQVDCDFHSLPLIKVVERLRETTGADLRIDVENIVSNSVDDIQVDLTLRNRTLSVVLDSLLIGTGLAWVIDDGVIWISEQSVISELLSIAVFDVQDLCRDKYETEALMEAIVRQAKPNTWEELGGTGRITSPKPGLIAIRQTQSIQDETLKLLEAYRFALRNSKQRAASEFDLEVVSTVYYRTYAPTADELVRLLPELIAPGTWSVDGVADGGTIRLVTSTPKTEVLHRLEGGAQVVDGKVQVPQAVLIVRHSRAVQREVRELLQRVDHGDLRAGESFGEDLSSMQWQGEQGDMFPAGGGMGGMGGGGFGGGFLVLPDTEPVKR